MSDNTSNPTSGDPFRQLTDRQREVACLLAEGLTQRAVAERLCLSACTVHEHTRHIYERLGCRRRGQLISSQWQCQTRTYDYSDVDNPPIHASWLSIPNGSNQGGDWQANCCSYVN